MTVAAVLVLCAFTAGCVAALTARAVHRLAEVLG